MKIKDLRTKSPSELRELLGKISGQVADSQFYHARSRSKNVKEIREWRKDRARILTLLKEKNI